MTTKIREMSPVRILATGEHGIVIALDDSDTDEDFEGAPELSYKVSVGGSEQWFYPSEVEEIIWGK